MANQFVVELKNEPGALAVLAEALAAHLEGRLPPHQRPRRIHVVDQLPRTDTGKLQRYLLRQRAEQ